MSNPNSSVVPGLRLIEATDRWAMAELEVQHCLVAVWRGQPTPEVLETRGRELLALTKRFPKQCALVEIVESTSKPPDDQARKTAMAVFRQLGDDLTCIGFVVEGGQIRGVFVRAIITSMLFLVKQPQPTKVFRDSREMLAWIRERIGTDRPQFEAELVGAIEHLRSLIEVRSAA